MARTHRFATETVDVPAQEGERVTVAVAAPLFNPSVLFPLLAVLATGDAASGLIDPGLPQFLSVVAVSSLAVGATLNSVVFPQLKQLPQGSVEVTAIKQRLLSQYDVILSRIKDLKEAAEKEIWMLARMCQLENKISAVGEPSYRTRRSKVKRVRESLQNSLRGRIELIDSYARNLSEQPSKEQPIPNSPMQNL
ncbi:hypothetical protein HN51_069413 [Arachis hypogaea]